MYVVRSTPIVKPSLGVPFKFFGFQGRSRTRVALAGPTAWRVLLKVFKLILFSAATTLAASGGAAIPAILFPRVLSRFFPQRILSVLLE